MKLEDLVLDFEQHIDVKAAPEKAFAAVLHRFGKGNTGPNGESMQLELEPVAAGIGIAGMVSDTCGASCRSSSRRPCWS